MDAAGLDPQSINEEIQRSFPGARVRCLELGDDYAIAERIPNADDIRPGGYISGPTQFGLLDATFWYASFVAIGRIEPMALTSELSIRYLRPAIGDRIVCRAGVESVSRRSVVLSGRVWCPDRPDKPTATAQGTYSLPLPR